MPEDEVSVREFMALRGVVLSMDERLTGFMSRHNQDHEEIKAALARKATAARQTKLAIMGSGTSLVIAAASMLASLLQG